MSAIVKLTELEFHKLMRYTEAVASLEAQAELLFKQVREKIAAASTMRDEFTNVLSTKYKHFKKDENYIPVETEFALHPVADTAPKPE